MGKISSEKLLPGMRLARPVTNKNGMVMLGEETELTDVLIEKIKELEIEGVYVKGQTQPRVPREEALQQLDQRFRNVENEPHMDLLRRLLKEHLEEHYG